MRALRLVPDHTRFPFMRWRKVAFGATLLLTLASLAALSLVGLDLGLDFVGGLLVEARSDAPVDLAALRADLGDLHLGDTALQTFGDEHDVLIRVQEQPGGAAAQAQAIGAIKSVLAPGYEIRRTEFIGPQVSHELLRNGLLAALLSILLIGVYVWFRFEWQFGLSAVITTFHDVLATFGLFSLFHLEFNLTVVAAMLTIAGYSINDTVVVFDRIRENLRKYKSMGLPELIDLSLNQTLSRTLMTSVTTLIAVGALLVFGGPVLRNFSIALAWGVLVGTYSSIFVASALLLHLPSVRPAEGAAPSSQASPAAPPDPQG
jgi:preprotein translocase subunit SecF